MENTYSVCQKNVVNKAMLEDRKFCWQLFCSFECLKTSLFYHRYIIKIFVLQATPYLLDLLHDRNPEVQRVCDATLQLIGEVSQ